VTRRLLGRSGLRVSPICLGTMMFGDRTGAEEATRIVDDARARGVNFIDTADSYSRGASEEMVGRLIADDRRDWVLATKAGNPMGGPLARGLSRRWLHLACEDSLNRLRTDVIDLYYAHLPDPDTPIEETVAAFGALISAGKVRHWGMSNFRGYQIVGAVRAAEALGVPAPIACQPYYNAMNRVPEVEVLPASAACGLGVVPYSPLARGVLTGKYAEGASPPPQSRAGRADTRMMETEFRPESLRIAAEIAARAAGAGRTPVGWAGAWLLANPLVTAILAGPRTLDQWRGYFDALDYPWDAGEEAFLDARVPPGHPSTPGFSDPRYRIEGRPAIRA